MLRSIIPGLIALVVACVLSSGVVVVRARANAHTVADSTAKDSVAHLRDTTHVIGRGTPAVTDSVTPPADTVVARHDSTPSVPVKTPMVANATSKSPAPLAPPAAVASAIPKASPVVPGIQPEARLPKLFAAMSARDAAKVLEQMADTDVIAILGGMPDKRAGEILGLLPATRSATIAKQVLGRGKDTP